MYLGDWYKWGLLADAFTLLNAILVIIVNENIPPHSRV